MSETISYGDFQKLDLRVAKILQAEEIPGKDRLLKLSVDIGTEQRTIVAGIKPWYSPAELIGKSIVIVANLEPKTLAGIQSHGMLLAAGEHGAETISLLVLDRELPAGTIVQ